MDIPQVCPRGRDIYFWVMENMQKISILHCKMEIFCFSGGSRKWISHKFAPGVEIFIAGKWKICKKSPFYTVKLIFFACSKPKKMEIPKWSFFRCHSRPTCKMHIMLHTQSSAACLLHIQGSCWIQNFACTAYILLVLLICSCQ